MQKVDDGTTLQQAQTKRSIHHHLTAMERKLTSTDQVHRSGQATKTRATATCRNLRRKQLRLAERQRKSEFIQSQIQLFPFEGKKKPTTLKKKSSKSNTAVLARDKATAIKAKSHHHHNSKLESLWNLCMAHPHMMDMLLCAYPALWKAKAESLESSCPNQDFYPGGDEAFKFPYIHEPSKKQRNVSQPTTFIKAKRTNHAGKIHDKAHVDAFHEVYTSTVARTQIINEDMIERSPRFVSTPAIVTPMFNDDDIIMKPFVSVVSDSMSGRKLIDDLTLESRKNLSPGHRHHFFQKDDDDISIHSSDFLMALEGIHVDHSEDSIGSKVGTVTVDTMKSQIHW